MTVMIRCEFNQNTSSAMRAASHGKADANVVRDR